MEENIYMLAKYLEYLQALKYEYMNKIYLRMRMTNIGLMCFRYDIKQYLLFPWYCILKTASQKCSFTRHVSSSK